MVIELKLDANRERRRSHIVFARGLGRHCDARRRCADCYIEQCLSNGATVAVAALWQPTQVSRSRMYYKCKKRDNELRGVSTETEIYIVNLGIHTLLLYVGG